MPNQVQPIRVSDFLKWEDERDYSRELVTVVSGQNLKAGHVVGRISASAKIKEYNPGNADGSQTAIGVLLADCDASAGDKKAVMIAREAIVAENFLTWFSGATSGQKTTGLGQLKAVGILNETSI